MDLVRIARWEVSCDRESTRHAYAAISTGGPEECGCEPCLNFAAARARIYTPDLQVLFEKLGISPDREVEVYHMARLESGWHLYGGWFHFFGSVLTGADAHKQVTENAGEYDLEKISESFSLGFSSRVALVREPFVGRPLVQLEFTAKVPWVLTTSEPN